MPDRKVLFKPSFSYNTYIDQNTFVFIVTATTRKDRG